MKTTSHNQLLRKSFFVIFIAIFPIVSFAQVTAPSWLNAFGAGGGWYENGSGIRAGTNGKIYFGGRYSGNVNLNGAIPPAATGATDCFSAELNSNITGTWATKTHTSGGYDYTYGYNIDVNNNTYSVGTVNSGGSFFVTKTNSLGATQWSISPGNSVGAYGICADASGNVYVTGECSAVMNLGNGNLPFAGGSDGFLVKYNNAGVALWSIGFGGSGQDAPRACELDPNGNIVVVGGYIGAPTYGTFALPASGAYSNLFVARFDQNTGAVMNVFTATNAGIVQGGWYEENDLRIDSCGNIYATGHFQGTANFGTLSVTSAGNDDVFLTKINPNGIFQWVVRGGGAGADQADGVALDKNWDVVISGHFAGNATFGTASITAVGNNDMFVAKYASGNGALMYVQKGGGPGYEDSYGGCTVDNNRQVYVTGGYSDNNIPSNTTNFGSTNLGNGYYGNIYVAKLDSTPNLRIIPQPQAFYCAGACYSIPFTTIGTFNAGNVFTAELSDATGSFESGTSIIGTFSGTSSGTIVSCIPAILSTSSNYLLRIYSSSPSYCSIVKCNPISISAPPTVTVTAPSTICSGGNVILTASGATTYSWTPSTFLNPTTGSTVTATPTANVTYSVIGTNAAGCTDTATTTLTISPASNPIITGITSICIGSSTTLTSSGSGTFVWSTGGSSSSIIVSPTTSTTYTVSVTDANGCTGTTSTTVIINPQPIINISGTTNICPGEFATLNATGGTSYSWSNAQTTSSISVSPSTTSTYSVIVSNGGCADTAFIIVNVNAPPVVSAGLDTTIYWGTSATLSANAGAGITYNWFPSTGLSCTNCANPEASPTVTTTYCVIARNANGCTDTSCVTIFVDISCGQVFIPNAFSPNSDNQNDVLLVEGNCIVKMTFQIFDRWGEKVFESTDKGFGWDGNYKGHAAETGIYVYQLKATLVTGVEIVKKGDVAIIR